MVFLRRPKKPLAALSTFLCLAWEVTPRLTRAMIQISGKGLAVRQEEFLDLVAVGLEQHRRAAQITDLLGRALDHTVALPALGVDDLAGPGNFEALFRARFGLQLGHLALLRASRPFEFGGAKDPGCLGTSKKTATAALNGRAVLNGRRLPESRWLGKQGGPALNRADGFGPTS